MSKMNKYTSTITTNLWGRIYWGTEQQASWPAQMSRRVVRGAERASHRPDRCLLLSCCCWHHRSGREREIFDAQRNFASRREHTIIPEYIYLYIHMRYKLDSKLIIIIILLLLALVRSICRRNSWPNPRLSLAPSIRPGMSATVKLSRSEYAMTPMLGCSVVNG